MNRIYHVMILQMSSKNGFGKNEVLYEINLRIALARRESCGENMRISRHKSSNSISAAEDVIHGDGSPPPPPPFKPISSASTSGMLVADTMLAERRLVRLLPELLLLRSDIGDMQELRPDNDEMPESEWEWL